MRGINNQKNLFLQLVQNIARKIFSSCQADWQSSLWQKTAVHLAFDSSPNFPWYITITKQGEAEPDIFF